MRKPLTEKLYTYILPKAEMIVVRDRYSLEIARKLNPENVVLYQDFAQETILRHKELGDGDKGTNTKSQVSGPYILININKQSMDTQNIQKIVDFCNQYQDHKKIFFPCDMNDDNHCFSEIRKHVSQLELYDRTKHSLSESLSLFYHADAGIGARLHFLLPLKLYEKPIQAIPYADKINKLITKGEGPRD